MVAPLPVAADIHPMEQTACAPVHSATLPSQDEKRRGRAPQIFQSLVWRHLLGRVRCRRGGSQPRPTGRGFFLLASEPITRTAVEGQEFSPLCSPPAERAAPPFSSATRPILGPGSTAGALFVCASFGTARRTGRYLDWRASPDDAK